MGRPSEAHLMVQCMRHVCNDAGLSTRATVTDTLCDGLGSDLAMQTWPPLATIREQFGGRPTLDPWMSSSTIRIIDSRWDCETFDRLCETAQPTCTMTGALLGLCRMLCVYSNEITRHQSGGGSCSAVDMLGQWCWFPFLHEARRLTLITWLCFMQLFEWGVRPETAAGCALAYLFKPRPEVRPWTRFLPLCTWVFVCINSCLGSSSGAESTKHVIASCSWVKLEKCFPQKWRCPILHRILHTNVLYMWRLMCRH